MKKETLPEELKNLSPLLQDLKERGDGYKIPEGYFGDMEDAVFARLKSAGDLEKPPVRFVKRTRMLPLFIRPRTATAIAAALALILVAVWFVRQPASIQPSSTAETELTEEDLESYVLENVHDFEPEQLVALGHEEPMEPMEETMPGKSKKNNSTSEELHPDDLDKILDEMTDEELEQIL